jgi:hypothetical protein
MLKRFTRLSLVAVVSIATATILAPRVQAQATPPAGYVPFSAQPAITGSAQAPINIPIKRRPQQQEEVPAPVVYPDTFTFAITGRDMDTWRNPVGGATSEFSDHLTLSCVVQYEEYPTVSGPNQRGVASDGTATWDVVGEGVVIDAAPLKNPAPAVVYVNTYKIRDNSTPSSSRNVTLNDGPIYVQQTLIRPAYQ